MRRINSILMLVLMVLIIFSGIAESRPSHAGPAVFHIFVTVLFILSLALHLYLNRKALRKSLSSQVDR